MYLEPRTSVSYVATVGKQVHCCTILHSNLPFVWFDADTSLAVVRHVTRYRLDSGFLCFCLFSRVELFIQKNHDNIYIYMHLTIYVYIYIFIMYIHMFNYVSIRPYIYAYTI
jgi:hypothetical protein